MHPTSHLLCAINIHLSPIRSRTRSVGRDASTDPGAAPVQLRYANNSNYKNDTIIRKEVHVSKAVLGELERIIEDAGIMQEDDSKWPEPDRTGRQELEIIMGSDHISFATTKLGSMLQVRLNALRSADSSARLASLQATAPGSTHQTGF